MASPEFSRAIVAFITDHVRSLDELQLLMAIIQSDERWWDSSAAAREFGMTIATARAALDRFAAGNLLDIRITDDVRYQFRPGTDELRDVARNAFDAYRRHPIAVARLVPREPSRRIADFADAFRIRRDDDG
jgi:DNA-binding MarR family transcriptional regulator